MTRMILSLALLAAWAIPFGEAQESSNQQTGPREADYVVHNYHFESGETMPEVRLHYITFGTPAKNAQGHTTNAVLILHGTSGSGTQFLRPMFQNVLFGPGELLDASKYYLIIPDNVGHGKSSKPSDGMRAHFPHYDYADMVALQHELVMQGLGVDHLRLIMGTSMGCMHSFMWGETYPTEMDALMPLACLPVEIAGRNRLWRKMLINGIREDPDWKNGDYTSQPRAGIEISVDLLIIMGSSALHMQHDLPTREAADRYLDAASKRFDADLDANDLLYGVEASRDFDPSAKLGLIEAPVMFVNSADDLTNPPELGIAEREIKKVKKGKFVLIPTSEKTHGYGTHTYAAVWQEYLKELLEESEKTP
jgi:homoserine O-acetyltransferase/O-succinyltransferase